MQNHSLLLQQTATILLCKVSDPRQVEFYTSKCLISEYQKCLSHVNFWQTACATQGSLFL